MKKKILAIADTHTGHIFGLNPPSLWVDSSFKKVYKMQKEFYEWYINTINRIGRVDILIVNGDCIDGKGRKNEGRELREQRMIEQAYAAAELFKPIKAKHKIMVEGTPYHSTAGADLFETITAKEIGSYPLRGKRFVNISGTNINIKLRHKIGRSALFHGKHTALARAKLDNILEYRKGAEPDCQILLFAHVHYSRMSCDLSKNWWYAMTLPALQIKSEYGQRECDGDGITIGVTLITIDTSKHGANQVSFEIIECPLDIINIDNEILSI